METHPDDLLVPMDDCPRIPPLIIVVVLGPRNGCAPAPVLLRSALRDVCLPLDLLLDRLLVLARVHVLAQLVEHGYEVIPCSTRGLGGRRASRDCAVAS